MNEKKFFYKKNYLYLYNISYFILKKLQYYNF